MKFCFIKEYRLVFAVLDVSVSGYYDWQKRKKSKRRIAREALMDRIRHLFYHQHGQMARSPTISADLQQEPEFRMVHRSRVAALMKQMGLVCKVQKKFVATTDSRHNEWIADNILARNFTPVNHIRLSQQISPMSKFVQRGYIFRYVLTCTPAK